MVHTYQPPHRAFSHSLGERRYAHLDVEEAGSLSRARQEMKEVQENIDQDVASNADTKEWAQEQRGSLKDFSGVSKVERQGFLKQIKDFPVAVQIEREYDGVRFGVDSNGNLKALNAERFNQEELEALRGQMLKERGKDSQLVLNALSRAVEDHNALDDSKKGRLAMLLSLKNEQKVTIWKDYKGAYIQAAEKDPSLLRMPNNDLDLWLRTKGDYEELVLKVVKENPEAVLRIAPEWARDHKDELKVLFVQAAEMNPAVVPFLTEDYIAQKFSRAEAKAFRKRLLDVSVSKKEKDENGVDTFDLAAIEGLSSEWISKNQIAYRNYFFEEGAANKFDKPRGSAILTLLLDQSNPERKKAFGANYEAAVRAAALNSPTRLSDVQLQTIAQRTNMDLLKKVLSAAELATFATKMMKDTTDIRIRKAIWDDLSEPMRMAIQPNIQSELEEMESIMTKSEVDSLLEDTEAPQKQNAVLERLQTYAEDQFRNTSKEDLESLSAWKKVDATKPLSDENAQSAKEMDTWLNKKIQGADVTWKIEKPSSYDSAQKHMDRLTVAAADLKLRLNSAPNLNVEGMQRQRLALANVAAEMVARINALTTVDVSAAEKTAIKNFLNTNASLQVNTFVDGSAAGVKLNKAATMYASMKQKLERKLR